MSEVISRVDLDSFLRSLFLGEIGALLDPSNTSHQWLVQYVRAKSASEATDEQLRKLDDFKGDSPLDDSFLGSSGDGLSILIVDSAAET